MITNNYTIKGVFYVVALSLLRMARKFGLTYNEVNILIYYLIIPLSWCIMLDCRIGVPVTTIAITVIWIGIFISKRHIFREWCDRRFQDSVDFLNWFNRWGGNYIFNSVIICVLVPLIVYGALIFMLVMK